MITITIKLLFRSHKRYDVAFAAAAVLLKRDRRQIMRVDSIFISIPDCVFLNLIFHDLTSRFSLNYILVLLVASKI